MGQLPPVRTQPLRPFQCIRVEFAGPFNTKRGYTRKPMFEKSYVALFICLATKAIHLEVTEDLSTGSFLLSFERFISRRGCPSHVFSDNGSNFVGAARILSQLTSLPYNLAEFSDKISNFSTRNVQWHFIPARSPHFRGIWEAGIRNMKIKLQKLMCPFVPTLMELNHLAVFAEGVLNSRPLLPVYLDDGEEFQCLTPATSSSVDPSEPMPKICPMTPGCILSGGPPFARSASSCGRDGIPRTYSVCRAGSSGPSNKRMSGQ